MNRENVVCVDTHTHIMDVHIPGAMGLRKMGDIGQKIQAFGYKMNKFRDSNSRHGDYRY